MNSSLVVFVVVFIAVSIVNVAAWSNIPDRRLQLYTYDDGILTPTNHNKPQRRDWCARWGDYCVPESKMRFATCCAGTRCVCGIIWKTGRCQCRTESLFG